MLQSIVFIALFLGSQYISAEFYIFLISNFFLEFSITPNFILKKENLSF